MLLNRLRILSLLMVFICVLSFYGCGSESMPIPEETPQSEYLIDSLPGPGNSNFTVNQRKINNLISQIQTGLFGEIHSLIIIQNDQLVTEKYFGGWTRDMLHPCFSTSKSVTSALIGIAKDQGLIENLNDTVIDFFPEYPDIANLDARKQSITIENLLTMSSGFSWNELDVPYVDAQGNYNMENDVYKMVFSPDWIKYMLDQPMSDNPGQKWRYNTGCTELLSGIISKTTGMSAAEYAQATLFADMGITVFNWASGPNNISDAGGGLFLHPVNMAMFGYLYLNNGNLNGNQIIPQDWVATSTVKHIDENHLGIQPGGYGYQWFRVPENYCNLNLIFRQPRTNDIYFALGMGGQYIYVVPEFDMVVTITSWTPQSVYPQTLIFNSVLRAVDYK